MNTLTLLPEGRYTVFVDSVHDGDTLTVLVPVKVKVRIDGIQAAELKTDKGKLAAEWVRQRIEQKWIEMDVHKGYKFGQDGERMGTPMLDGQKLADLMVEAGMAVRWDGRGKRPFGETNDPQ